MDKEYFQTLAKQLMFHISEEEADQLQEEFVIYKSRSHCWKKSIRKM